MERAELSQRLVCERSAEIDTKISIDHYIKLLKSQIEHLDSDVHDLGINSIVIGMKRYNDLNSSLCSVKVRLRETSQRIMDSRAELDTTLRHAHHLPIGSAREYHSAAGILCFPDEELNLERSKFRDLLARDFLFVTSSYRHENPIASLPTLHEGIEIRTARMRRIENPLASLTQTISRRAYESIRLSVSRIRSVASHRRNCIRNLCHFFATKLKEKTTSKAYIRIIGNQSIHIPCRTWVFVQALKELGYGHDAVETAAAIDTDHSGLITYAKFFRSITCTLRYSRDNLVLYRKLV